MWKEGMWGSVCEDGFTTLDAEIVCRELMLAGGIVLPKETVADGTGTVLLSGVNCSGTESKLSDCFHEPWGKNSCSNSQVIGVRCLKLDLESNGHCDAVNQNSSVRLVDTHNNVIGSALEGCNSDYPQG